jgi:hypothetical protein
MSTSANDFFNEIDYPGILDNIKGIFTSDASISTLMDFERVLDEADLYAFKNWDLGELVSGPEIKRYTVTCVFMYPYKLMPDPSAGKRLISVGCNIKFKKTKISVPIKIETPMDYKPGGHFPKMVEREIWLVRIEMPKELMNDIREGSIDLAGQTIDLEDLDAAYEDDLDKEAQEGGQENTAPNQQGMAPNMGMGQMPPGPGGMV